MLRLRILSNDDTYITGFNTYRYFNRGKYTTSYHSNYNYNNSALSLF